MDNEFQFFGDLPYPETAYPQPPNNPSASEGSLSSESTPSDETSPLPSPPSIMPGRNHHAAPKFDGRPASLSIFIDEIEQLAGTCKLSEKQTIDWTIRYAPNEERELWQMQDAVATSIWADFKKELFDLYPGSTGERKYSVANLTALVEDQALRNIRNAEDLGAYRRSFLTIATFLKSKSRLTDREISGYFVQGMDPSFRAEVQSQLRAENPRHHSDDPYTLAEISSAALFVLTCNYTDFPRKEITTATIPIKKETYDMSQGFGSLNIGAIASEIMKHLNL
ncbi:hypothetical protein BYT27DRAFT_7092636, partial [Phlegmacium glaucopus]